VDGNGFPDVVCGSAFLQDPLAVGAPQSDLTFFFNTDGGIDATATDFVAGYCGAGYVTAIAAAVVLPAVQGTGDVFAFACTLVRF
jgi:hypothetical protein